MDINYKVYIKLDDKNNVVEVESTAFYQEQELIEKGFIFVDEGSGNTYGHAQPYYLKTKFGKPKYDEYDRPNFKYKDSQIVEIEDKDKDPITTPSTSPTQEERIQALESAMLELVLGGTE